MSYDIYLAADVGGPEIIDLEDYWWNYTSNIAPMLRAAGFSIKNLDGLLVKNGLPLLRNAVNKLLADPEKYKRLNPSNGWGDYDSLVTVLTDIISKASKAPNATFRVSC